MLINWKYFSKWNYFPKLASLRINFQVPERVKGTVIEKYIKYWEGLINDYAEVVRDTIQESKSKPYIAAAYISAGMFFTFSLYNNPSQLDYRDNVIHYQNLFGLVGRPVRNPGVDVYLKNLESAFNNGLIRRFSLGICCFIWIDNYNEALGLYKAQCKYLKPKYLTFYERIIDFGFLNKFWILEKNMRDYDVNPNEWIDFSKSEYGYKNRIL